MRMNSDQINSAVRSLLKISGAVLMARGLSNYAAIVNSQDAFGLVTLLASLWLSHQHHASAVAGSMAAPEIAADTTNSRDAAPSAEGTTR